MTLMTPPPMDQQQQQQEHDEMLVPRSDLPEGPQPMEAAQAEIPSTVDAPTVDAPTVDDTPTAKFTWTIDNFSSISQKLFSDIFCVGGYKWRILIFPKGNGAGHLSMYIDVADSATLPYGWSRYAHFNLTVVNQIHSKYSIRKDSQHQFNARESDWGFINFMPLAELYDPARGYLVNDTCIVEADISVRKDMDWSYDSKKETGYVGLKNQGATCYMNSLLQTLYHISYFRKAVYHMPTTENDMPSVSIPLALQSLFYKLQYSDTSVATKELTTSFGWDTYDSFMQHDVQELNRVLCEKLEGKMKGTVVEGTIQQLFEGHHMNYIECINVDYKSTRKESFYDLQLDVKGCKDVYASFDKYVEVEQLEGDNKYHAEHYGLQDARKGMLFIDFPPVLQLQLKRFEYDCTRDTMVKINDRYEFPLQLDLDMDNGKYLSPDADRSNTCFRFKFDDERVTKEESKRALEEQYGGEEEMRLKKEQDEKELKRKEKAEAHLYTTIKVACDEDLREQIGNNIHFDLVDYDKVRSFRVQINMPFMVFKEEVAKEFGIPIQYQRFWLWAKRQNNTYRPNRTLTPQEEAQSVGLLREVSTKANNAALKLFLELEMGQDLRPIPPPEKSKENLLLFLKLYEPSNEKLRYVGRLFVNSSGKPEDILVKLNEMAGYDPDQDIDMFEEIKFVPNVMCERVDKKSTFRESQLEDGDIICFQKSSPQTGSGERYRYPDVPSFLEYVHNRLVVRFRTLEKPKEDEFSLELSKLDSYDNVVEEVAQHIGLHDPSKIRLTSHNCYSQQPKAQSIKFRGMEHLTDMLIHSNQVDLSHPDAELRLLEVFYHKIYKIFRVNEKIENINDQYCALRAEELGNPIKRVYFSGGGPKSLELPGKFIPEEEKNLGSHDRLIHVYHFLKDTTQNQQVQNFGHPFLLVIREGETLAEVKLRIQKKLQVPDEEFSKWKFAFLSFGRPEYLQDSDIVSTRFQRRDIYGAWEQYLGLEHIDSASKRSNTANQYHMQLHLKRSEGNNESGEATNLLKGSLLKTIIFLAEVVGVVYSLQ
ncbi:hypothetical protein JHK84_028099 [Glycine max]|nr:hypothetical protein JHK84_028099 [Glycine max]